MIFAILEKMFLPYIILIYKQLSLMPHGLFVDGLIEGIGRTSILTPVIFPAPTCGAGMEGLTNLLGGCQDISLLQSSFRHILPG